jgi:hypothetical protein
MPRQRAARSAGTTGRPAQAQARLATVGSAVRAASVLTLSCAAGCGVLSAPAAPSGLEKQVARGERISAASRAHASRQARNLAPTPAPAVAQRKVAGRQVTAIGDSVMAASAMALESVLPGIYIDAVPSRQMPAGLAVVRRLAASGRLRPVVVMGLGTNYIVTTRELNELVRLIGPHRKLVLINTFVPDEWSKEVNATEAAYLRRHPAIVLADWFDTIRHRTDLLWPDDVHPQLPGTSVYARMVYRAVQATRQAPGAPPFRGL